MSAEDVRTIQDTYASFERGDLDGTLSNFHDDIEWIEPDGYFPSARGRHRGVNRVREIFQSYGEYWERFDVKPEEYIDAGDGRILVIGMAEFQAKGSDETYRARLANLWTMRDGKAERLQVFNDTALVWRALGGHTDYWG